jgi:hypothetical protein
MIVCALTGDRLLCALRPFGGPFPSSFLLDIHNFLVILGIGLSVGFGLGFGLSLRLGLALV